MFLSVWLVSIIAVFWVLFWQQIVVFDRHQDYSKDTANLNLITLSGFVQDHKQSAHDIQVAHFLDPQCPCYRFAKTYVKQLVEEYSEQVSHTIYLKSADRYWQDEGIDSVVLDNQQNQILSTSITASPAVIIIAKNDPKTAYFGPHSDGVVCGQGTGYVPLVINNLQHEFNPEFINTDTISCNCQWQ